MIRIVCNDHIQVQITVEISESDVSAELSAECGRNGISGEGPGAVVQPDCFGLPVNVRHDCIQVAVTVDIT